MEYASGVRPCYSALVGRIFNQFGYGLALKKNSPYTDLFSVEILKMRQVNFMETLHTKWFKGTCVTTDGKWEHNLKVEYIANENPLKNSEKIPYVGQRLMCPIMKITTLPG